MQFHENNTNIAKEQKQQNIKNGKFIKTENNTNIKMIYFIKTIQTIK